MKTTISSSAVQTGMVATSTEAMPDGSVRSAQNSPLYDARNISAPRIVRLRHSSVDGAGAPRSCDQPNRTTPAIANRMPAAKSGGTVPTAMRIARYVDPQTT